ncbi:MAG: hypothetical protein WCP34_08405 [Pseudomonadota bacterium]
MMRRILISIILLLVSQGVLPADEANSPSNVTLDNQALKVESIKPSTKAFNRLALNIIISGTGRGTVTSHPERFPPCDSDYIAKFHIGDSVALIATPSPGSLFTGWNGDCSGSGDCMVRMTKAKNVNANFMLAKANQTIDAIILKPATLTMGGSTTASATASSGLPVSNSDKLPENAPRPIRIGIAVSVNEITKISDQTGTFEGNLDLRLRWNDPNMIFDARKMGANRLTFAQEAATKKLAGIWNPAITLANGKVQVLEQGMFIYADGTVIHIQRLQGTFDAKYNLAAFPFDTQSLPIRLVSRKYNMDQVSLTQDQVDINKSGLRQGISLSAWKPKRIEFTTSRTRGWNGEYFSEMEARILVSRIPQSYLFAIFIPLLLIMLIPTLMTLYTKADIAPRLTAWSASILSLVALSFTFSTRYSALDSDSFVVQLVTIGFGYQMFMILFTITLLSPQVADRFSNKFIVPEVLGYLRWTIPPALIGLILTQALLTALS